MLFMEMENSKKSSLWHLSLVLFEIRGIYVTLRGNVKDEVEYTSLELKRGDKSFHKTFLCSGYFVPNQLKVHGNYGHLPQYLRAIRLRS